MIAIILLFFSSSASAAVTNDVVAILQTATFTALDKIFTDLQSWAMVALSGFILIQFIWTNIGLLTSGADLEKILAKFAGALVWASVCITVFTTGPDWLKNSSNYIMNKAIGATGATFDPAMPIDRAINIISTLLKVLDSDKSILGSLNPFPSIMMGLISCVILAVSALLAFRLLMLAIETKIVITLSPISFALLGLQAFRDQGLAPARYIVSLAYKALLIGAVLAAMTAFSDSILASFKTLPAMSDPSVWPSLFVAAMGYLVLGALAMRIDSIAVLLASGTTQMSTGDSAAVGAIAGAVAGAAMAGATGGAAAVAGAGKASESMADVMKNMAGGSVSDASSRGRGSEQNLGPAPVHPAHPASMSTAGGIDGTSSSSSGGSGGNAPAGRGSSTSVPNKPDLSATNMTPNRQNALNAEQAAQAAGASPAAATAAANSAYLGGSAQEIESAVVSAGGTQDQGYAAAAATGAPRRPQANSGASAGIDGAGNLTDQKIDKLMDTIQKQGQGQRQQGKPKIMENLKNQLSRDSSAGGVRISMDTKSEI